MICQKIYQRDLIIYLQEMQEVPMPDILKMFSVEVYQYAWYGRNGGIPIHRMNSSMNMEGNPHIFFLLFQWGRNE